MQGKFKSGTQPISVNDQGDFADSAGSVPELPLPGQRWTVRRKAAVVEAVRGGWVPVEEISQLYDLSADEIVAWERDIDRYGIPGLRSTRLQIYRDNRPSKCREPDGSGAAEAVRRRKAISANEAVSIKQRYRRPRARSREAARVERIRAVQHRVIG